MSFLSLADKLIPSGTLYGWAVVLDPGHGGIDPGSSVNLGGGKIVEDEYVYDVTLRAARLIRERDGLVFLTIKSKDPIREWGAQRIFPDDENENFTIDNTTVVAGTSGLTKRTHYGNRLNTKYPKHKRAWISVHFDVVGTRQDISGVRIISPRVDLKLAKTMKQSFGENHRLRDEAALVASGDPTYGLRRLFVLESNNNEIEQRVLIELGNFNNKDDRWRIRDPKVREAYALAITRALEKY